MKTRVEEALDEQSKYCYPNGVLINKLNIQDQEELDKVEASFTYLRLNRLIGTEGEFKFDLYYYLNLHKYIFQDIYSFAGDIRDENISKGLPFCRPEYIVQYLKYLLDEMKSKVRNIKTIDDYIDYLSYYFSEINLVHPFREGNGRTQREYFRQLVQYLNKYLPFEDLYLDYSLIKGDHKDMFMNACVNAAVTGDLNLLKDFFRLVLKKKVKENDKKI